jgi:hypothetical protein
VLPVLLICAVAQPAFADGVPMDYSGGLVNAGVLIIAVIVIGFWGLGRLLRWMNTRQSNPKVTPAEPKLPAARALKDRDSH